MLNPHNIIISGDVTIEYVYTYFSPYFAIYFTNFWATQKASQRVRAVKPAPVACWHPGSFAPWAGPGLCQTPVDHHGSDRL